MYTLIHYSCCNLVYKIGDIDCHGSFRHSIADTICICLITLHLDRIDQELLLNKNAQGQMAEVSVAVPATHPQNPSHDAERYGRLTSLEVAWPTTSPAEATGTTPVAAATANASYPVSTGMVHSWATL